MILAADPLGALDQIDRTETSLGMLAEGPSHSVTRQAHGPTPHAILDELAAAAAWIRAAAGRLRINHLLGFLIKACFALWVVGLFLALLVPLLVPLVLLAVFVFMIGLAWLVWRMLAWSIFGSRRKQAQTPEGRRGSMSPVRSGQKGNRLLDGRGMHDNGKTHAMTEFAALVDHLELFVEKVLADHHTHNKLHPAGFTLTRRQAMIVDRIDGRSTVSLERIHVQKQRLGQPGRHDGKPGDASRRTTPNPAMLGSNWLGWG